MCQLSTNSNCTNILTATTQQLSTTTPMATAANFTNTSSAPLTAPATPVPPVDTTPAPVATSPPTPSQLPCVNYTAAQCPLARCQLYSVAGVNLVKLCIPQQCKSLLNQSACVGVCTWNGTMCDRTPCSKLNVDTCTPEVCVLSSDGSCSGKACASLSSDACDTTRCYVNSNGKCADQTCAMMTTSSKCASPQCYWDGSTNTCTTPPCSSYQSGCPAPRCQVTSTGACGNAPCSSWKTAVNCTVAPGCLWSNDACSDRPCQLFDATTCPIGRCQWDTSLKACTRPACSASNTSGSCPTDQCYWSSLTSTCVPIPCSQFSTNASCPVDRCYYVSSGCQDLPCSMIAQKSVCSANAACVWNVPTTATGTASASGTCKAMVVDVPCAKRTDLTTCVLPQCYADASSQKCTLPPCNLYTSASSCPSDRCAFNVSGSASCAPIPCLALPSATTCALFSDRCAWDSTSGWCKPVACEQLQSCDLARCALTSSGACASIQCEAQLTKAQCPTSSYTCMWFNDQCGYGNCGLLRNQTACGTDSKCTWAVPSGSSGSCIATSFLTSLPCSALSGADLCASAPNSRCTWVSSGNSGQCTPTDLTSLLPCFNFTSQGQSACPTSYCKWWNKLCVNPLCSTASASASASACAKWNCQWVSTTSTCADQQWQQFPCEVFSAATCPAGRCSKNATGCFTPQTSSSSSTSSGLSAALAAQLTTTSDGTVINATTGVPVDATAKACLALSGDARSCLLSTGACVWTGSVCAPPPCAQFTDDACPTKRCRSASGRCMELCPQSNPYYCSSTGTCAKQASGCVTCPSSQVQCVVDSSCHTSQTSCPCPDATPNRCANDGRCVYNTSTDCDACPSSTPVKCWDGSCSSDESGCPCPLSNPLLCSDNTTCVSRVSDCDVKCPKLTPVKCWNGACATTDAACPCSENLPFRCAVDGKCYSSQAMCPCPDTTQQRCATGRCVANTTTDCVSTSTTCPSATPALCADGSCAATAALCGCASAMATQLPLIDVAQVSTTFDVTRYLELAARVNYTVCGKDWKLIVTVVWSATEALTGKAVGGTLYGRTVSVPPNVFTAGTQYIITAVAYVNGSSTSLSSSASVIMLATAPTPKVTAVGGNRTVSATNIGVAVQVSDVTRTSSDVVAWVCTGSDGVSACDSSMTSPLTSATSGFVQIAGPVPAGVYIVTAFYKGISASMWLTVKATAVPSVQIIAPQDTTGALKQLYMYASVQNGGKASKTTWYIGGSAVGTGSVLTAAMPTTTTTVIAKACDAVDSSACGQATWNYVPVTPVTGTCSLSSTDGTASTAYTALATALSVSSTWTSTTATLKFSFYLEYTTKSGSTARIQLAPYDSEVSSLSFTAPMLSGNIAAQVTVGVVARDAGTRETVASAVCSPVALASAALTSATIVITQTTQLANALAVNDTNAVFSAAATLASAAGQAGANASQLVSSVLGAVSSVVSSQSQDGSTLSRAARSAVLQTLSTAVNNAASAMNASQQQQAVQTVIAALTSPDSQNSVDVSADGPATLSLLSQVAASASVSVATEKLSLQLAASATLGVTSTMNASNVSIAGVAHTGDDIGGAMLNHTKCSLALPTTFNVSNTNSSSTVSLAVAQYDQSPVGTSGLSNVTALKSAIAEFNVQADGNRVNVSQVWPAIRIELQVSGVVNSSMLKCQYYDKTVAAWTTTGVTTVGYDASRQVLLCDTTHLSMFGGTETTVTSGTPGTAPSTPNPPSSGTTTPSPGSATPAPGTGGTTAAPGTLAPGASTAVPTSTGSAPADSGPSSGTVGAIVGGCIAGLFAVVIVGFLVVRSRSSRGTGFSGDIEMSDNNAPLTAMGQQLAARPGYNQL